MFINFTNHSSDKWGTAQRKAAEVFGEIIDIPFPAIPPTADSSCINSLAEEYTALICGYAPEAVLVQGEMTFCFAVVNQLLEKGIRAVCATTERAVVVRSGANGETIKQSEFKFVRFRDYG